MEHHVSCQAESLRSPRHSVETHGDKPVASVRVGVEGYTVCHASMAGFLARLVTDFYRGYLSIDSATPLVQKKKRTRIHPL